MIIALFAERTMSSIVHEQADWEREELEEYYKASGCDWEWGMNGEYKSCQDKGTGWLAIGFCGSDTKSRCNNYKADFGLYCCNEVANYYTSSGCTKPYDDEEEMSEGTLTEPGMYTNCETKDYIGAIYGGCSSSKKGMCANSTTPDVKICEDDDTDNAPTTDTIIYNGQALCYNMQGIIQVEESGQVELHASAGKGVYCKPGEIMVGYCATDGTHKCGRDGGSYEVSIVCAKWVDACSTDNSL